MLKSYSAIPTLIIRASEQWNLVVHIKADVLTSVSYGSDCLAVQIFVCKAIPGSSAARSSAGSEVKGQIAHPVVFPTQD